MSPLIMPICFPKPHFDESPLSYLFRVAKANSYKKITWLYSLDTPSFVLSPEVLFDQLLETEWTGFSEVSEEVGIICKLGLYNLNISLMRYCPMCLEEEPYHRAKWYLKGSVVCLDHGCWLVDTCPQCHSTLNFKQIESITHCKCGANLASSTVREAPKGAIRYGRFYSGLGQAESDSFEFSSAFDGRKYLLNYRIKLISILTRWCLSSHELFYQSGGFVGLNSFPTAEETIRSLFESWLSSADDFEAYLTTLHQKLCHNQSEGDELFRRFYKMLFRELTHPALKPIKDAIQSYMNDHWIHTIDKRNSLFVMESIDSHKWLALQAASRELDIPKSFIRQGVESGEVRHQLKEKESREYVLVHRDDVIKYNRLRSSYVNATTAASLLGVTKKQMYQLKQCGLISWNSQVSTSIPGQYSLDELQQLMDLFNSKLMTVDNHLIPLSEAIRKIGNGIKKPFETLVKAVLSGEVRAYLDSNYIGFRQIQIDTDELKTWYLEKTKRDAVEYFTMQALRSHFQVSSDLIPQLVNKGVISRVEKRKKYTQKVISVQAVNQFKDRYVLLAKLSLCSAISSAALMKKFEAYQVYPIDHGWEVDDKFVQKIYYRHELLSVPEVQVLISSMADWEYESF